jgi:tetratricopeptide (TPR) repeat protein
METDSWISRMPLFAATCLLACTSSLAQTTPAQPPLLNEVHTVAAAGQATPVEETFTLNAAGNYKVTLVDLGAQLTPSAPLASVKLAITSGSTIVGTPLTAAGSAQFSASAAGNYIIHVVGTPGTGTGSGPIGIQITNAADGSQVASFSDTLAVPASNTSNATVLDDSFTVSSAGTYVVTLSDLQLPQALSTLTMAIAVSGGSLVAGTPLSTAPGTATVTATVSLQPNVTYRIFGAGQQSTTGILNAGLYGVSVIPTGGGAAVYANTVPVGAVTSLGSWSLTAGTYNFSLTDLGYPVALAQVGAVITTQGQSSASAQLTAAGNHSFTATSATYQVFAFGVAASSGQGSYVASLQPQPATGTAVFNIARAVTASGSGAYAYSFDTSTVGGETYELDLADFAYPTQFTSLSVAAVQNGALLAPALTLSGSGVSKSGSQNFTPTTGPVSLLVFAQPAASAGAGLFGVNLIANGAGSSTFQTTQSVGQLFAVRKATVTTGGSYQVTVADVGFPAAFKNLAVLVTRGTTLIGSIYSAGSFTFSATGGDYYVNFLAQPTGTDQAGTYSISLGTAPPPTPPSITLQATPTSVASGGTVTLAWSTQNATTCTGSGGWSGSEPTSGTATSAALTATTTFTLTCTGPGGSAAQSQTITIAAPSSHGGGGGAIGVGMLAGLFGVLTLRAAAGRRRIAGLAAVAASAVVIAGCGGAASRLASHMQRGQAYFGKDDFTHASVEFRNALQINPKDLKARLMLAQVAQKLGQIREAAGFYQSVIDTTPDNVEASAGLARLFVLGGAPDRALKIVEPVLAKHPDDASLLIIRSSARLRTKDEKGGLADAERALQLAPTNEEAIALRAGYYQRSGDLPGAVALVSNGVKQVPQSTDLREVLLQLYLASQQPDKAEEQLRMLVQLKPQVFLYRKQLASFYDSSRKLDEAQRVLEEAVKALPKSNEAKLTLVSFLSTQRTREQGEKILRDFIAREPDNYDLRFGLGDLLQRTGALKEALDTYGDVAQRDGTGPNGLLARDRIAAIDLAQGRDEEASKQVDVVLKKSAHDYDALLVRGQIELKHKDAPAAIGDFRAVLRDQPRSAMTQRLLAQAYVANGELGLAEQTLHTAIDLVPADVTLRLDLAQVLLQNSRADQAVALLEEVVHSAPTDPQAREALIRAYLIKPDLEKARTAAEDLKTLQPNSAAGSYFAGLAAEGQHRPNDAQKEYEHALSLQPGLFDVLSALARLDLARGQSTQAITLVKNAADRDPKSAPLANLLGELYLAQKDPLAVQEISRAVSLAPDWWPPYRNLAVAKFAAKDIPGAIAAYQSAIKVAPTEPRLITELALLYEGRGRIDEAISAYEAWNQRNPRVQIVANNLAMLLANYRRDRASLDRARDLTAPFVSSNDGSLLDTTGWVHVKRGEYSQALPILQRAVERAPDSKEIRYHLAMAELQAGESDRARDDLKAALSGTTHFAWSDDARKVLAAL